MSTTNSCLSTVKHITTNGKRNSNSDKLNTSKRTSNLSLRTLSLPMHKRSTVTPGTTRFRVSVDEFRDKFYQKSNKTPKLKQAQTDNYYNTRNSSLPLHHYQSYRMDTDTSASISESTESESELVIVNNAYPQYTTPTFPETHNKHRMDVALDAGQIATLHNCNSNITEVETSLALKVNDLLKESADKVSLLLKESESEHTNIIQQLIEENMRLKEENKSLNDEIKDLKQSMRSKPLNINTISIDSSRTWSPNEDDTPRYESYGLNTISDINDSDELDMVSPRRMQCYFSALPNGSKVIQDISDKTNISITSTYHRKTTKPKHKHKRKRQSAKVRYHAKEEEETAHDLKRQRPHLFNISSWRTKMNLQNDERCMDSRTPTPRSDSKFVFGGNGITKVASPSLSKISEVFAKRKE